MRDVHKFTVVVLSDQARSVASVISKQISELGDYRECTIIRYVEFGKEVFEDSDVIVVVGALGICVRMISTFVGDKKSDPAVVAVDSTAKYVIPVISGHIGGANELARKIAGILGSIAVITTQSDNTDLWALDLLEKRFDWQSSLRGTTMNSAIINFVNRRKTALLIECKDRGVEYLEGSIPDHVTLCYDRDKIKHGDYALIIAVTPYTNESILTSIERETPILSYHPKVINIGIGCRKDCASEGVAEYISSLLIRRSLSPYSVRTIATIDIKREEPLIARVCEAFTIENPDIYTAEELKDIDVPNPSMRVLSATGSLSVSESSALLASNYGKLLIEKQKCAISKGNEFTVAVAMSRANELAGYIEIIGAGPGDPELISVRGKRLLEQADLILYAGSLVPKELTHYAKNGAVVKSSASMTLEEQFQLMKEFYDRGEFVARLHTGDPCIYGAIQEQMAFFDRHNMRYGITPGISSFQAAAAALKSQFTIPERVQTIILTRGEGNTPMPERESIRELARSRSTMCIFLSAGIVDSVQEELLVHYPPDTPVAACYHLTWKDERIYRGELKDLAEIVKSNNLTLTTMIVVGDSIDNRRGLSKLYSSSFKHIFRQ